MKSLTIKLDGPFVHLYGEWPDTLRDHIIQSVEEFVIENPSPEEVTIDIGKFKEEEE